MLSRNLSYQEEKANFIIKELESQHGQSWACFVEPLTNFVQCMGVSKRPDQYLRFTCGGDRIRVWRLPDVEKYEETIKELRTKLEHAESLLDPNIQLKTTLSLVLQQFKVELEAKSATETKFVNFIQAELEQERSLREQAEKKLVEREQLFENLQK